MLPSTTTNQKLVDVRDCGTQTYMLLRRNTLTPLYLPIFRHDRFLREPYIFVRAKIATLQILKIYYIKTIFHPKGVHFKRFQRCMYVCTYVCDQVTRLSQQNFDGSKRAVKNILI